MDDGGQGVLTRNKVGLDIFIQDDIDLLLEIVKQPLVLSVNDLVLKETVQESKCMTGVTNYSKWALHLGDNLRKDSLFFLFGYSKCFEVFLVPLLYTIALVGQFILVTK